MSASTFAMIFLSVLTCVGLFILILNSAKSSRPNSQNMNSNIMIGIVFMVILGIGSITLAVHPTWGSAIKEWYALIGITIAALSINIGAFSYSYTTYKYHVVRIEQKESLHFLGLQSYFMYTPVAIIASMGILLFIPDISFGKGFSVWMAATIANPLIGFVMLVLLIILIVVILMHPNIHSNHIVGAYCKSFEMIVINTYGLSSVILLFLGTVAVKIFGGATQLMIFYNIISTLIAGILSFIYFTYFDLRPRIHFSCISHYILIRKLSDVYKSNEYLESLAVRMFRQLQISNDVDYLDDLQPLMITFIKSTYSIDMAGDIQSYKSSGLVPTSIEFFHALAGLSESKIKGLFGDFAVTERVVYQRINGIQTGKKMKSTKQSTLPKPKPKFVKVTL